MEKNMRETTSLCVEIMNSARQAKGKLGHVVQISRQPFDVNVMRNLSTLNLSSNKVLFVGMLGRSQLSNQHPPLSIPEGMYDCGDGFYDPIKRTVINYDFIFLRNTGAG